MILTCLPLEFPLVTLVAHEVMHPVHLPCMPKAPSGGIVQPGHSHLLLMGGCVPVPGRGGVVGVVVKLLRGRSLLLSHLAQDWYNRTGWGLEIIEMMNGNACRCPCEPVLQGRRDCNQRC
jgi:hypothetical protein